MRIGALAAAAEVEPRTIRFYETAGVLPAPRRTTGGYRDYGESDLERLMFVVAARRAGLAVAQIAEVVAMRDRRAALSADHQEVVDGLLADIAKRLEALDVVRNELESMLPRSSA